MKIFTLALTILILFSLITKAEEFQLSPEQERALNNLLLHADSLEKFKKTYGEKYFQVGIEIIFANNCKNISKIENGYKNKDLKAQYITSELIIDGICYKQETNKAMKILHRLADKENQAISQIYLAEIYKYGTTPMGRKIIDINNKEYIYYLQRASNNSLPRAQQMLANEYFSGELILQDDQEALRLLNTVIKKGQYDDIVKSYVGIIVYYLKIQLKIAKEGLKSGNLNYDTSYIKNAYKYGTECSNIGIGECMIMMPSIYMSYKNNEQNNEMLIETYKWLILGKVFTTDEKRKQIASNISDWFLSEIDVSYENKIEAQKRARKWIPDSIKSIN